ncbi:MAG: hypothetical protein RRY34_00145 [Victivallaceae bacterium]
MVNYRVGAVGRFLAEYLANQEGLTKPKFRHWLQAVGLMWEFIFIGSLLIAGSAHCNSLQAINFIEQRNLFIQVLIMLGYGVVSFLCVWGLSKIRNIYISTLIFISIFSGWLYITGWFKLIDFWWKKL